MGRQSLELPKRGWDTGFPPPNLLDILDGCCEQQVSSESHEGRWVAQAPPMGVHTAARAPFPPEPPSPAVPPHKQKAERGTAGHESCTWLSLCPLCWAGKVRIGEPCGQLLPVLGVGL